MTEIRHDSLIILSGGLFSEVRHGLFRCSDEQLVQDFAGRPQAVLTARRMGPRLHHCIGAGLQTAAAANQNLSDRLGAADGRRSPHARLSGAPRYWRAAHGFLLPGLGALLRARAAAVG